MAGCAGLLFCARLPPEGGFSLANEIGGLYTQRMSERNYGGDRRLANTAFKP